MALWSHIVPPPVHDVQQEGARPHWEFSSTKAGWDGARCTDRTGVIERFLETVITETEEHKREGCPAMIVIFVVCMENGGVWKERSSSHLATCIYCGRDRWTDRHRKPRKNRNKGHRNQNTQKHHRLRRLAHADTGLPPRFPPRQDLPGQPARHRSAGGGGQTPETVQSRSSATAATTARTEGPRECQRQPEGIARQGGQSGGPGQHEAARASKKVPGHVRRSAAARDQNRRTKTTPPNETSAGDRGSTRDRAPQANGTARQTGSARGPKTPRKAAGAAEHCRPGQRQKAPTAGRPRAAQNNRGKRRPTP